jgi:NAD(P)H-binding
MRSFFAIALLAAVHLLALASCHDDNDNSFGGGGIVLILGATGRTGSLLYHELVVSKQQQQQPQQQQKRHTAVTGVRALVRSVDRAREILHCNACDESEGIFVGDIQNLTSLLTTGAFENVQTVAIATGVTGQESPPPTTNEIKAIEFTGIQNAVRALAELHHHHHDVIPVQDRRVVLCSSRGTTTPISSNEKYKMFGDILFYKLNTEAFLGSIGMFTSIVKPCGLSNDAGSNRTLLALHDDAPTPTGSQMIPRADVARVMAHLVMYPPRQNLRFDLCSIDGAATTDLVKLMDSAKWDWQQATAPESHGQQTAKIGLHEAVSRTMQGVPSRFLPFK